ncbi:2016_t:CDS:2 [Funneliformis mosseae]|uniref:2016_t:CDS:1 n=1 Tax=Funneliformis mosseae TaxID=27381 RepID=A0A9N8YPT4_FUNMO|nr:2016_t:CDS:2 [Funneliformis mosseae]
MIISKYLNENNLPKFFYIENQALKGHDNCGSRGHGRGRDRDYSSGCSESYYNKDHNGKPSNLVFLIF